MSKFDRNRIKDGWEKLCTNKQTNKQTDKPTDTTKIMVTWPWTQIKLVHTESRTPTCEQITDLSVGCQRYKKSSTTATDQVTWLTDKYFADNLKVQLNFTDDNNANKTKDKWPMERAVADLDSSRFLRWRRRGTLLLGRQHAEQFVHAALQAAEHRLLTGRLGTRRVHMEVKTIHLSVHRTTHSAPPPPPHSDTYQLLRSTSVSTEPPTLHHPQWHLSIT